MMVFPQIMSNAEYQQIYTVLQPAVLVEHAVELSSTIIVMLLPRDYCLSETSSYLKHSACHFLFSTNVNLGLNVLHVLQVASPLSSKTLSWKPEKVTVKRVI